MGQMIDLNEKDFSEKVEQGTGFCVVDFGAEWCAPCKKLHPILEQIIDDFDGQVTVYEVDAGESPAVAQKFGVISVPQTLMFVDGKNVDRIVGLVKKEKIVSKIKKYYKEG